jgi:quercetin dioxygenase-like cupin family protein
MTHEEYIAAVERGDYPTDPLVPPATDGFADDRGAIRNLLLSPVKSIALITSKKGSVRANHYHKTDWHFAYVLTGLVQYSWRRIGHMKAQQRTFRPGETVFSPPMIEHAFFFLADTEILTMAKNIRSHEEHEADVMRIVLISPDGRLEEFT